MNRVDFHQKWRRILLPLFHPLDGKIGKEYIPPVGSQRALIRERGDEYVYSVQCKQDELVAILSKYGYTPNFLSTLKYVDVHTGRSWEVGSMAYRRDWGGKWMHHAYWFPAEEDDWDFHIGHHKERNYFNLPDGPQEHTIRTEGYYEPFDPNGHLNSALDGSSIVYEQLEYPKYKNNDDSNI